MTDFLNSLATLTYHGLSTISTVFVLFASGILGGLIFERLAGYPSWFTVLGMMVGVAAWCLSHLYTWYCYELFDPAAEDF